MNDPHEHVFVEEREPTGRLILGPCLTCYMPALVALQVLETERLSEWRWQRADFIIRFPDERRDYRPMYGENIWTTFDGIEARGKFRVLQGGTVLERQLAATPWQPAVRPGGR